MTIDEAIKHCEEVASGQEAQARGLEENPYIPKIIDKFELISECRQCAEEHEQLAKWLEELKELRELKDTYAKGMEASYSEFRYKQGRADAIREVTT